MHNISVFDKCLEQKCIIQSIDTVVGAVSQDMATHILTHIRTIFFSVTSLFQPAISLRCYAPARKSGAFTRWCCLSFGSVARNAYTKPRFSQKPSTLELWSLLTITEHLHGLFKEPILEPLWWPWGWATANIAPWPTEKPHSKPGKKLQPVKFTPAVRAYSWSPLTGHSCFVFLVHV